MKPMVAFAFVAREEVGDEFRTAITRSTVRTIAFIALLPVLLFSLVSSAAPGSHLGIRYREGRLTIHAEATPANEVFTAIAEQTGVRFVFDSEIRAVPITIDIEDMELERAIGKVVCAVRPAVAMFHRGDSNSEPRLDRVALLGPGKAPEGGVYDVEPAPMAPASMPTPDVMQSLIEAGVPGQTAQKLIDLDAEMHKLQTPPVPGSYRPEDLSPTSREYIQTLVDRGMSTERAVQVLLLGERHRETLNEMWQLGGGRPGKFASRSGEIPADDPVYP